MRRPLHTEVALPKIPVTTIATLPRYLEELEKLRSQGHAVLWYRGCGRAKHDLKPGLYRHSTVSKFEDFLAIESDTMSRFRQRSIPHLTRALPDDWEVLFMMQHFRVPTRLLDWTENAFVALYFALTSAAFDKTANKYTEDAAVWILAPETWNTAVVDLKTFEPSVLSPGDRELLPFEPSADAFEADPRALFGAYNNSRIVAQRGVFTIFGKSLDSMDGLFAGSTFPQCLWKIEVASTAIDDLAGSLFALGVTDSVVWPELDGLAMEMRRQHGYRVS